MATSLAELRDRLCRNHEEQVEIVGAADREKRDLSDAERANLKALQDSFERLNEEIETRQRFESQDDFLNRPKGPTKATPLGPDDDHYDANLDPNLNPNRLRPGHPIPELGIGRRNRAMNDRSATIEHLTKNGWRRVQHVSPKDYDNLDDADFRSFGEYLRAIRRTAEGKYDRRLESLAMSGQSGADGGFLIPWRFATDLLQSAAMQEPWLALRSEYEVQPGAGRSLIIPALADADRSGKKVANFSLSRAGEGSDLSNDTIALSQLNLELHKAAKLVYVSNELMSDSAIAMESVVSTVFAKAVAMLQSSDCISGTGAGQPLGIFNAGDKHDASTSTAAGSLTLSDIGAMAGRLEPVNDNSSAWVAHFSVLAALLGMETTNGGLVWAGDARDRAPRQLLGMPIYFSDAVPALNTVGDITLGNWSQYIYLRTQPMLELDRSFKFGSDQSTFRLKLRDAGQPWRASTLTDRQSHTLANFVRLATRS